ncbi:MAG: NUDIX domain-containing protein, partial [Myxococcales bacterium]|nr:NUDIX domain-containing protein [Myxococcales bacterium]
TDEKVLCVPAIWVKVVLGYEGIRLDEKLKLLLEHKTHRNRHTPNSNDPDVEHDDRYKQLIPYIVVVNSKGQVLAYNRGSKGGEKRLESKWAIGFGGHVNDQDESWMDGICREIEEEISDRPLIVKGLNFHGPIGFLDDDSDDVGRHHLGVVYVLRADGVVPREVPEFSWETFESLRVGAEAGLIRLENWARLALPMVRAWMESQ